MLSDVRLVLTGLVFATLLARHDAGAVEDPHPGGGVGGSYLISTAEGLDLLMTVAADQLTVADPDGRVAYPAVRCVTTRRADGQMSFTGTLNHDGQEVTVIDGVFDGDRVTGILHDGEEAFSGRRAPPKTDHVELLGQARALVLARKPDAAIDAFIALIDGHRYDLPSSGPALIELVACFQKLRDDAGSPARYRTVVGRYLTAPPPLDGTSLPDLATAQDDLLWKAWPDDERPRFELKDIAVSGGGNRQTADGKMVQVTHYSARVFCVLPRGWTSAMGLLCSDSRHHRMRIALADGSVREGNFLRLSLNSFDRAFSLEAQFEDLPTAPDALRSVAGEIDLVRAREWRDVAVPLRVGETWDGPEDRFTITSCGAMPAVDPEPGSPTYEVVIARERRASDGKTLGRGEPTCWLHGPAIDGSWPLQNSATGDEPETLTLRFAPASPVDTLVFRVLTAVSTRPVPFTLPVHVDDGAGAAP